MSDEELISWASYLRQANFRTYPVPSKLPFLTPIWHAARDQFEAHPFGPGVSGLVECIEAARVRRPLALAMLREFHVQYTIQVLTS